MPSGGRHIHDRFRLRQPCPNFGQISQSCRAAASVTAIESVSFLRANKVWANEVAVLMTKLREASERGIHQEKLRCAMSLKTETKGRRGWEVAPADVLILGRLHCGWV